MMNGEYAAVIITYFPDVCRVKENVDNLTKQGFFVVIVDNGSHNIEELSILQGDMCVIKKNGENKGIAYGLNVGMQIAESYGSKWVLSLDQDSIPGNNMLEEYKKYISLPNIGALCPRVIRMGKKRTIAESLNKYEPIDICPTAGFFLSISNWKKVGGYDNQMFIDYVDYDMCMRLKKHGLIVYMITGTQVFQELGNIHQNAFLSRISRVTGNKTIENFSITYNHSPFRNYYFVRNSLLYIHKYSDLINVPFEKKKVIKWEIKKLILEKNKIEQMKAIIRGVKDYRKIIEEKAL